MAGRERGEHCTETGRGGNSTMRVFVATDIHLGFMERDEIRGNDSFEAFEEVLRQARAHDADMLLLGGDLFHENKPSRYCLHRAITLLRQYCLGDRRVALRVVSAAGAPGTNDAPSCVPARPNYEDPNFNVALPVFSIHGNHDDPSGAGGLAALDLLADANLVNYFGKAPKVDDITISPLLIVKGETRLALYGLGNIRDERLYRTYESKSVRMLRPVEEEGSWFNLFVVHQNRSPHSVKGFLSDHMIDDFVDFVLWGHEHESLIEPTPSSNGSFFISQPGSTVAVSLTEGEARKKQVGLLEIQGDQFRLKKIPLETVRPFVMDSMALSDVLGLEPGDSESVVAAIERKVEEMVSSANADTHGDKKKLPLIRLKVDSTGFSAPNPQRFGHKYVGKVANPADMIVFSRKKKTAAVTAAASSADASAGAGADGGDALKQRAAPGIEELVQQMLGEGGLQLIPPQGLHLALANFVKNKDGDAIELTVKTALEQAQTQLKRNKAAADKESIHAAIQDITLELQAAGRGLGGESAAAIDAAIQGSMDADEILRKVEEFKPAPADEKKKSKRKRDEDADDEDADGYGAVDAGENDGEEEEKAEKKKVPRKKAPTRKVGDESVPARKKRGAANDVPLLPKLAMKTETAPQPVTAMASQTPQTKATAKRGGKIKAQLTLSGVGTSAPPTSQPHSALDSDPFGRWKC